MNNDTAKLVSGYWPVLERVMIVRIKGKPFNLSFIQVYAPTSDCSNEKIDGFYEQLESAKKQSKSQDVVIVVEDPNAKVGKQHFQDIVGPHGVGEKNERGEKWIDWCHAWTSDSKYMVSTPSWETEHGRAQEEMPRI